MRSRFVGLSLAVGLVLLPHAVQAQGTPLSEVLVQLIQADVRLAPPPAGFPSHEAHFLPGEDQQLAPFLFNQAIVSQLSTYPVGTSAGGFNYTYDPTLGTYSRATSTFGSSFAERAVTIGRRRLNIGANYQHASYNKFEGSDLDDGSITFYLTHEMSGNNLFFEGDLISTSLKMKLKTDTTALFANYGLTDRLDVGVALPFVSVKLDATVDAAVLRLATGDTGATAGIHTFPGGASTASFSDGGSASGVGDILLRSKYQFLKRRAGGLAAAVDLRLPTGDEDNLLGTGTTQGKFLLIGSSELGGFSPHFNLGYTASGDSENEFVNVSNEFNYVFGAEYAAASRLTVSADLLGRRLIDSGRLEATAKTYNWRTQAGQAGSAGYSEFAPVSGSLNLTTLVTGVKFNPTRNLLISANVLFPLTDSGIRSRPIPVIGIDYAF